MLTVADGGSLMNAGQVAVSDSATLALASNAPLTNTGVVTVTGNGAVTLAKGAQATGITEMVVGVNAGDNAVLQLLSDNTYAQVEHSSIVIAQNADSAGQMIIGPEKCRMALLHRRYLHRGRSRQCHPVFPARAAEL